MKIKAPYTGLSHMQTIRGGLDYVALCVKEAFESQRFGRGHFVVTMNCDDSAMVSVHYASNIYGLH